MPPFIDLTGKRFSRLIVIKHTPDSKFGKSSWLCKCNCGNEKIIRSRDFKNGKIKSCGCLLRETTIKRSTMHNHCRRGKESKIYKAWEHIIQRCINQNDKSYSYYGGRGIMVCDSWKNSFQTFLKDMGEPPTSKHQIDRIDNNQGYYKENCRWVTKKEQMRNTRHNHIIMFRGKIQCLAAWAEEFEMESSLLRYRLKHWSIEKALTTPVKRRNK